MFEDKEVPGPIDTVKKWLIGPWLRPRTADETHTFSQKADLTTRRPTSGIQAAIMIPGKVSGPNGHGTGGQQKRTRNYRNELRKLIDSMKADDQSEWLEDFTDLLEIVELEMNPYCFANPKASAIEEAKLADAKARNSRKYEERLSKGKRGKAKAKAKTPVVDDDDEDGDEEAEEPKKTGKRRGNPTIGDTDDDETTPKATSPKKKAASKPTGPTSKAALFPKYPGLESAKKMPGAPPVARPRASRKGPSKKTSTTATDPASTVQPRKTKKKTLPEPEEPPRSSPRKKTKRQRDESDDEEEEAPKAPPSKRTKANSSKTGGSSMTADALPEKRNARPRAAKKTPAPEPRIDEDGDEGEDGGEEEEDEDEEKPKSPPVKKTKKRPANGYRAGERTSPRLSSKSPGPESVKTRGRAK